MTIDVFVFGTLKKGKPLPKCGLEGALLLGKFKTLQAFSFGNSRAMVRTNDVQ